MDRLAERAGGVAAERGHEPLDLAVIGAGPCGLGVGIAARRAGLSCTLFDKGSVVSSIAGYPTYMTFFSTADRLELGGVPFIPVRDKPTRREALRYYQRLVPHFDLDVMQYHEVLGVAGRGGGFGVRVRDRAGAETVRPARNVVVATGYFDHPNLLGVPGEDLPHVAHRYREGHPYFEQRVVVVGGGNSAVDAALELVRWGAHVTLVHFGPELDPNVKPWVRPDAEGRIQDGTIATRFGGRVAEIRPDGVVVRHEESGATEFLPTDFVLAMTGYTPDPWLLRSLGVGIDEATGIPVHDPETMLTNVPGVFLAGVVVAGNNANKVFIENGRGHGERIARALTGTA